MPSKFCVLVLVVSLLTGAICIPSCKTLEKGRDGLMLGAAAGGSIGALVGKKAGNPAIGATIGAALGGSTGAFLSKKLYKSPASAQRPIYILNGTAFKEKEAQEKLANVLVVESVKVLDTSEAITIYGGKGENGAILINYKETAQKSNSDLH